MDIQIGPGPDFCLRRGNEILNYNAKITLSDNGISLAPFPLSHRSLAMVAKQALDIIKSHGNQFLQLKFEIDNTLSEVKFLDLQKHQELVVKFHFQEDLTKIQRSKLTDEFSKLCLRLNNTLTQDLR